MKELRQTPTTGRDNRGNYSRVDFKFKDETYATLENGIEMPIDNRRSKIYRNWFDFEVVSASITLNMVMRAYEIRSPDGVDALILAERDVSEPGRGTRAGGRGRSLDG